MLSVFHPPLSLSYVSVTWRDKQAKTGPRARPTLKLVSTVINIKERMFLLA